MPCVTNAARELEITSPQCQSTSTLQPHGTMTNEGSIEEVDVLRLLNTGLEVGSSPVRHEDVLRQGIEPGIDMNAEMRTPTKKKQTILKRGMQFDDVESAEHHHSITICLLYTEHHHRPELSQSVQESKSI